MVPVRKVSVPSRGLRYLNLDGGTLTKTVRGFRPLSGIKVSELSNEEYYNLGLAFSSPRGE